MSPDDVANAVLSVTLRGVGRPKQSLLLQNYPNPFNPETWIPYQVSEAGSITFSIYGASGRLIRTLSIGFNRQVSTAAEGALPIGMVVTIKGSEFRAASIFTNCPRHLSIR